MKEKILLKSLHICFGIDVRTYDSEFNEVVEYSYNTKANKFYNESEIIKSAVNKGRVSKYYVLNGYLNEQFLLHSYNHTYYLFGPFRVNCLSTSKCLEIVKIETSVDIRLDRMVSNYIKDLQTYSLDNIKDIVQMLHYLLSFSDEDSNIVSIHKYTEKVQETLSYSNLERLLLPEDNNEQSRFEYEKRMLKLVKKGKKANIKKFLRDLEGSIMTSNIGDSLRNEKNYSIVIFEKLSQLAIDSGMSAVESTRSRDLLIADNEAANDLKEVMNIRKGAIVFYTEKISEISENNHSKFLVTVLDYIDRNLYENLTIESIAKQFSVSQTTLNLTFKNELGITVKKYLTQSKMKDAKRLLAQEISISEISQMLGYADSSHFCKKFKKESGMTPTEYRRTHK
ncbi:YSIRK-targeted surface antigen transcriptional regulator [Staphylococcus simulans]